MGEQMVFKWCGRLVLLKSDLEINIPIYSLLNSKVSKGILIKIIQKSFKFLWSGNRTSEGIPLVKWSNLAHPKKARRMGSEE